MNELTAAPRVGIVPSASQSESLQRADHSPAIESIATPLNSFTRLQARQPAPDSTLQQRTTLDGLATGRGGVRTLQNINATDPAPNAGVATGRYLNGILKRLYGLVPSGCGTASTGLPGSRVASA